MKVEYGKSNLFNLEVGAVIVSSSATYLIVETIDSEFGLLDLEDHIVYYPVLGDLMGSAVTTDTLAYLISEFTDGEEGFRDFYAPSQVKLLLGGN